MDSHLATEVHCNHVAILEIGVDKLVEGNKTEYLSSSYENVVV